MNRPLAALTALGCALAGLLLLPVPAGAAPTPTPPQLQIAIDDSRTAASVGQTIRYTVKVTNLGSTEVPDMLLTQTLPAGTTVSSSTAKGPKPALVQTKSGQSRLQWAVSIDPGATVTRHSVLTVTDAPDALLRLASVACVQAGAKTAPLVCAADSDLLPAGAAAESQARAETVPPATLDPGASWWWYAGGGAVAVALVGAGLLWRRRYRPTATSTS